MSYSVVILNDASLGDKQGAIHTWLEIKNGNEKKVFSFSNSDYASLIGKDSLGVSSANEMIETARKPTEFKELNISKQQYDLLIKDAEEFYKTNPKYDLTPDNEGDYNCVTAARTLLQNAGIYYLDNIQSPFGVKYKILGGQSSHWVESVLATRDNFDESMKEEIRYFKIFIAGGFDSKDIMTRINFDSKRPITIPYGSKNDQFADFYLNFGGGQSPIHEAARFGRLNIVRFIVEEERTLVSVENANGNTALHYAARFGHLNIVEYLVNKSADFNCMNKVKMTPLHFATLGGHLEVAKYLVQAYLLQKIDFNRNDDVYGATPLHYAASSGNLALIEHLFDQGVDVNQRAFGGDTPLHYGVSPGGNLKIVQLLIQKNAISSIESNDGTPTVHYAALGGHLDIFQYLIDNLLLPFNVSSNGVHTLHYAVRGGNLSIVEYLVIQKLTNVNVRDNINGTPLHDASERGFIEIVRFLLKNGANSGLRNKLNKTPIDSAREMNQSDVVRCLQSVQICISQRQRRSLVAEKNHLLTPGLQSISLTSSENMFGIDSFRTISSGAEKVEYNSMLRNGVSSFLGDTAMLANLVIRKYTGENYRPAPVVDSVSATKTAAMEGAQMLFQQTMRQNFKK